MNEEKKPTIAVCGGGMPIQDVPLSLARMTGVLLARLGYPVINGACPGYPGALAEGYIDETGHNRWASGAPGEPKLIMKGYSPFSCVEKHVAEPHRFPTPPGMEVVYTGIGPGRNFLLVQHAQIMLYFPGGVGTLTEKIFAAQMERPMVVYGDGAYHLQRIIAVAETDKEKAARVMNLIYRYDTPEEARACIQQIEVNRLYGKQVEW